ncbi:solute carrier family 23 protein [Staphylococcus aureus]
MKNLILSVQHLLAMYAGAILVPIIVGTSLKFTPEQIAYLVTVDIFMCGVATFLQANKEQEQDYQSFLDVHSRLLRP